MKSLQLTLFTPSVRISASDKGAVRFAGEYKDVSETMAAIAKVRPGITMSELASDLFLAEKLQHQLDIPGDLSELETLQEILTAIQ